MLSGARQVEPLGDEGPRSGLRPVYVCVRNKTEQYSTCLSMRVCAHACTPWENVCVCAYVRGALRCSPC